MKPIVRVGIPAYFQPVRSESRHMDRRYVADAIWVRVFVIPKPLDVFRFPLFDIEFVHHVDVAAQRQIGHTVDLK